ncbi:MAG: hypothetical protein HY816_20180 [Candidatus Wallbacteria bacterium]|nr:hypothetical protein [Candidatus Wallbacteria bacterium]
MTDAQLGFEGLKLCWGLAWFLVAYLFVFRPTQIAEFRQGIFFLRDDLFAYAVEHDLLDTPAHRHLRWLLNGLLRMAPLITPAFLLICTLLRRREPRTEREMSMKGLFGKLSEEADRRTFEDIEKKALWLTMKLLLFGSLPGILTFGPVVILFRSLAIVVPPVARIVSFCKAFVQNLRVIGPLEWDARRVGRHPSLVPTAS